ncbi:MAG: nucleoside triphosphate pyrophosphohydrolase [Pseudomonadota bacterium]
MQNIEQLLQIMSKLRDKDSGCPWDIEQDFASIATHALEEAYEVVDAIDKKDMKNLKEELGDLLLQVVFHSQMAKEQNIFNFDDVVKSICDKMIRRHPHIFADAKINNSAEQKQSWEKIKEQEKLLSGFNTKNAINDVPVALPAVQRADKIQRIAAKQGFDWDKVEDAFVKLEEEIDELKKAISEGDANAKLEEVGDVLFSCVNIARKLEIDSEEALRLCNNKFLGRFNYINKALDSEHRNIRDTSFQELNDLWDQAKIAEHNQAEEML